MENKKTTELIDLLQKLEDGDWLSGGKYEKIMGELETRYPFYNFLHGDSEESIPSLWGAVKKLQDEIKLLKRHKHDVKTGDVMVRI